MKQAQRSAVNSQQMIPSSLNTFDAPLPSTQMAPHPCTPSFPHLTRQSRPHTRPVTPVAGLWQVIPDTSILPVCIGGKVEDGTFNWVQKLMAEEAK